MRLFAHRSLLDKFRGGLNLSPEQRPGDLELIQAMLPVLEMRDRLVIQEALSSSVDLSPAAGTFVPIVGPVPAGVRYRIRMAFRGSSTGTAQYYLRTYNPPLGYPSAVLGNRPIWSGGTTDVTARTFLPPTPGIILLNGESFGMITNANGADTAISVVTVFEIEFTGVLQQQDLGAIDGQ